MNSSFLKLNVGDVVRGLVVAVLVVVLGSIQQALDTHGLDVVSYDWAGIINTALTATVAYLVKNVFTDSQGKVLGKI